MTRTAKQCSVHTRSESRSATWSPRVFKASSVEPGKENRPTSFPEGSTPPCYGRMCQKTFLTRKGEAA